MLFCCLKVTIGLIIFVFIGIHLVLLGMYLNSTTNEPRLTNKDYYVAVFYTGMILPAAFLLSIIFCCGLARITCLAFFLLAALIVCLIFAKLKYLDHRIPYKWLTVAEGTMAVLLLILGILVAIFGDSGVHSKSRESLHRHHSHHSVSRRRTREHIHH